MRISLVTFALLLTSSAVSAQPARSPEQMLPADAALFLRYDGYLPHRKAYDQTALAQAMKEGLNDFIEHAWTQAWAAAEAEPPKAGGKVAVKRKQTADRFLDAIWARGFAATFELVRVKRLVGDELAGEKRKEVNEDVGQLTVVFPQGGQAKNLSAIDAFLRLIAEFSNVELSKFKHAGRTGQSFKLNGIPVTWWPEGDHLVLTTGKLPAAKTIDVAEGRRPSVAGAKWHKELLMAPAYETDIRGFINIESLQDQLTGFGRDALKLTNITDRFVEHLVARHLGLTSLRNATFHLGFDGKYQRSTVRLGIVSPEKRSGLASLITGPVAFDAAKLPPLPPDIDYVSARHVDWERIYDFAKGTYTAWFLAELFAGRQPDQKVPDLDRILGFDFRRDFLQQLDTTIITWGAHSEGPFFLGQAVAVRVKDAAKVRKGLDSIVKAMSFEKTFAADKTAYRGIEMYVFRKMPLPATMAIHNDWLVLGLAPQPVQGFIMRGNGKYRTWKPPTELAAAFAKEAKQPGKSKLLAVTVSDPRPVIEMGLAVLPIYSNFMNIGEKKIVDIEKIPNAQSINEWLFPNVGMIYDDGNALRWENYYSINEADDLLLAPYLSIFGGLLARPFRFADAAPAEDPLLVIDPKKPAVCEATAEEKDGTVTIRAKAERKIPYTVSRTVWVEVVEKVNVKGEFKQVTKKVPRTVVETAYKNVMTENQFVADGEKVRVTRRDRTVIEPKELPKLLNGNANVVLVTSGEVSAEELQKLAEGTLIIRVTK